MCSGDRHGQHDSCPSTIADHNVVKMIVEVETSVATPIDRGAWDWKMANWRGVQTEIANFNWDTIMDSEDAGTMVEQFSSKFIETAKHHILFRRATFIARSHPWITAPVLEAVKQKCEAFGTDLFPSAARKARDVLAREYTAYHQRLRQKLAKLPRSSKQWWKINR